MPETILCIAGKCPKILSFIDSNNGDYTSLTIKMREDINEFAIRDFFNELYNAKLDTYGQIFLKNHGTNDLVNSFKNIITKSGVIGLEEIYNMTNQKFNSTLISLQLIMQEFFKMFEIVGIEQFSAIEYQEMVRQLNMNPLFMEQESIFKEEEKNIKCNSYFLGGENSPVNNITTKKGKNKTRTLIQEKAVS